MEVTNTSYYRPWKTIRNGLNGEFAQVNLDSPKDGSGEEINYVTLRIRFLDAATGLPVLLNRFTMSFYDFDQGRDGRAKECFSTTGYSSIQVAPNASQIVEEPDPLDPAYSAFCSTEYGELADNPTSPTALTAHQRSKMIEVTYEQRSEVSMRFAVGCCSFSGRNFLMAGESDILPPCDEPPSPPPISPPSTPST